jgi:hypothetical protein
MPYELVNTRWESGTYVIWRKTVSEQAMTAKTDSHPLAGTRMSGADMVVQVLADEGVDTIFGYSGGAILPTYDAVFRYNDRHRRDDGSAAIPLIVPANEQGAGFMASGYARASGKVGVVMVTSGPGATNTVTPVRDCMADSIPIVVICGQVPRPAIGTDAFGQARRHGSQRVRAGPYGPARPGRHRHSERRAELGRRVQGRWNAAATRLSPALAGHLGQPPERRCLQAILLDARAV